MKKTGFTLLEIVIVIAVLTTLIAIAMPDFLLIKRQMDVKSGAEELASIFALSQSKAIASEDNKKYGVYLDTAASPNQYILFKGEDYESRDVSADQAFPLPQQTEFYDITLASNQIVFDKLTGIPVTSGSVSIRSATDLDENKTVYISALGTIGFDAPEPASDTSRIKDSRHVHVDYSRYIIFDVVSIPCTGETLSLYFDGSATPQQQISICENISGGNFDWDGAVEVDRENQTIHIHTHKLNDTGTQFCIHRDRRYNTKSLKITISGDNSGPLVEYSADGLTTSPPLISSYASDPVWQ